MLKIRIILLLFNIILFNSLLLYSSEKGMITGKVIDAETGEILRGATIMIPELKNGSRTDIKGTYKIKDIPFGLYSLKASYVGYVTREINSIEINKSSNEEIIIALQPQYSKTEEVIVEAKRTNDNAAALLSARKNAGEISDGISAEEIKKLPDSDAGQSLQRVAGVTLMGGKYIYVRGSNERYSNTTLNGASLSTTETDKKAFAFDMFPADFLENANVAKSFTPDKPGNFAGALVELNTIDYPSGFSFKIGTSSSVSDNLTTQNSGFITYQGSRSNIFGFSNGLRSMPSNIPQSRSDMSNLLVALKSDNNDVKFNAQQTWSALGKSFNNKSWKTDSIGAPPNLGYSMAFTNLFNVAGNDLGVMASANWGNSYKFDAIERAVIYTNGSYDLSTKGSKSTYSTDLNGLFNLAYKIGDHSSINLKNIYNNTSDDELVYLEGVENGKSADLKKISYNYVQKELYAGQLTGEHRLNLMNSIVDWKMGYSQSMRDEPDYRRLQYVRNHNDEFAPFTLNLSENPGGDGTKAGRYFSNLHENALSGQFNYMIPFKNFNLKFGGLIESRYREFKVRSFTLVKSASVLRKYYDTTFQQEIDNWTDDNIEALLNDFHTPEQIFNDNNFNLHGFGIAEDSQDRDSYVADETTSAAYVMTDIPLFIADRKLRIITGFRVESNLQNLRGYYPEFNPFDSTYHTVEHTNTNLTDFLPSLNLVYSLSNSMNLRASATKTLTRPTLREIAPFTFYDFSSALNVKGNSSLKRTIIENYDLRYEWFMNPGEIISVGGFYKVFHNAIEETIIPSASETFRTFTNANGVANTYGIEFEIRKNLDIISSWFKYFSINSNLSLINSQITVEQTGRLDKRTMWGQSPYSFNLGLFFFHPEWGTSFNLAYNIQGRRIVAVANINQYQFNDPHIYELPRNMLDITFSQELVDNLEIKFTARDLFNDKLIFEQGGKIVSSNWGGRKIGLSLGYKFK
ncbi:TonB-dependent receptor [Bacteroidetes/Chlorobi group bacterium ChocPot_Mid]|nr:MAG: TonB-dependent receptor [Bacteroidetes/Chlorobi group bacterium ChocPot_Mid]